MAEATPTPAPAAQPAPVAPAVSKKFPIVLVVVIGFVVLCLGGLAIAYFVLFSGMDKKYEDAKDSISDIYGQLVEDLTDETLDYTDKQELIDYSATMFTDINKETSMIFCFALKDKDTREECDELKTATADAKKAAVDQKRIYDAGTEDDNEDELEDLDTTLTDASETIVEICDISVF